MRRCYRNAALVILGTVIFTSSTFSNSCSFTTLEVYAAEAALSEDTSTDAVTITRNVKISESVTVTETVKGAENLDVNKFSDQIEFHTGEENVETEIPADESESDPTVVAAEEENNNTKLEYNEYQVLLRIVEAEAGGEDITGKMLVANVIMNRIHSKRFPNTVTEVVYQKNSNGKAQFSPTVNGRIDSVKVSQGTIDAVERVLNGEDSSNGALYFRSVHSSGTWHDQTLRRVLEHGNHIFYTI